MPAAVASWSAVPEPSPRYLRESGKLEIGQAGPVRFVHGVLRIGEAMSTHLIHQVKAGGSGKRIWSSSILRPAPPAR